MVIYKLDPPQVSGGEPSSNRKDLQVEPTERTWNLFLAYRIVFNLRGNIFDKWVERDSGVAMVTLIVPRMGNLRLFNRDCIAIKDLANLS